MPRKERRKKEQERGRQDAAKGSRTLYDWMKPRVAASTSEQVEEDSEDREETQESEESEAEDMEADDEPNEADSVDDLEQQVAPQEPQIEARAEVPEVEEPFSMLPELQYPNDPAHVVTYKIRISESFIRLCNNYGPCQPVISYPKNVEGRSFQKKWYERNSWLEYSPQKDAMFCFSCRLFLNEEKYRGRAAWKSEGISRWRTALEKIKEHASSESHMIGMVRWKGFQSQALDIALETANREVQAARDKEKQRNREILCRLISITLYLARQGLPFRGDSESSTSENRGNFLELVEMFSKYDSVVKLHLDVIKEKQETLKRPQVSLLSNRTQNDLIKALAISVRRVILEEIHKSKIFSILMDETTDVSHTEQVSFVVRYVHDFKIKERFIQVFNVQSTTGEALEKEVISMLNTNNLNIDDMRGQGYDGAANMSGIYNGLQSRLQRQNPKALYVHCHAHSLNLVLVESAKSSIQFVTFFSLVEKLYAFVANSSKRHAAFMEIQKAMYPEDRPLELQKLSDTRWACRESALRTMRKVIPALKQFLEEIVQKHPPDASAGDASILLQSINFEFLVCLEIATPVFQETAYASNALQQKDLDLAASYRIVDGVLQSLRELRNDEKFQEIFTKVKERAESMAIDLPSVIPGQGRRRKMPERYKYSATSATEDQQYQTLDDYYRVRVFYVFLDTISQELQRRFKGGDNTTWGILNAFHCMTVQDNWKEPVNEEAFKSLQKLCQFYELEEVDKLRLELKIFYSSFPCLPQNTAATMLNLMKENNAQEIFPLMLELLTIYATLPVTTATVERTFSKLKLVKTKLRSLSSEERLSDLLLLAIEKDIKINNSEVISIFKEMAHRRVLL